MLTPALWSCGVLTFAVIAISAQDEKACSISSARVPRLCHGGRQLFQRAVHRASGPEAAIVEAYSETGQLRPEAGPLQAISVKAVSRDASNLSQTPEAQPVANATASFQPLENGTMATAAAANASMSPVDRLSKQMAEALAKIPLLSWLVPIAENSVLWAYGFTASFTATVILVLYWKSGFAVIMRILIYLAALSTMKLVVKNIYVTYRWEFPSVVTATHFFCGSAIAFSYLFYGRRKKKVHVPSAREFFCVVFPISLGFAISVVASNVALYFCSAAFTEIIGATSPVWTALMLLLVGQPISYDAVGPIALVVLGCMISTSGEMNFSGIGFVCCFISCLGRAVKSTLQQMAMTGDLKEAYDPITLLAWMCVPSFFMMMGYSLTVEGLTPYRRLIESDQPWGIIGCVLLSCVNASILNLSNLFCTRDLGAIGLQLVGQMKGVLTVLGALALFHEAVTTVQILGYIGVVCGVALFSRTNQPAAKNLLAAKT
mmetsp:Transcript_152814/g.271089  ORF Transcript_152814/g.271089 Transcript_152814/m.271089 type:complete len:489 (-) Transcript_152814:57-1523(-)